jgi:nitrous oxidase accessory protein
MGKIGKTFALLLVISFLLYLAVQSVSNIKAQSKTIVVPDNYPTIASAIGNATDDDTIIVKQGIYVEHSLQINKTIRLMGENKNNTTIVSIDESTGWNFSAPSPFPPPKPDAIHITADNVVISGFTITSTGKVFGSMTRGIYAMGNGTIIVDNIITELNWVNSAIGIDVYGQRNQIIGNSILGVLDGISFSGSNSTIIQNTIENGQLLCSGQNNVIMSNVVAKGNTGGINLNGDDNLIFNNTVTAQNHGIWVDGTGNTLVLNNASGNVLSGISLRSDIKSSGNNTVYSNTLAHNRDGLDILEGKNNIIYANNFSNNHVGLTIVGYNSWMDHNAYSNTVYHNNFISDDYGAADWSHVGSNAWDNGVEGNFWDDYAGTDANLDGIGDVPVNVNVPYTIGNSNPNMYDPKAANSNEVLDRYPLMTPFDVDSLAIELPEWVSTRLLALCSSKPSSESPTPTYFEKGLLNPQLIIVSIIVSLFAIAIAVSLFKQHQRTHNSIRNVQPAYALDNVLACGRYP